MCGIRHRLLHLESILSPRRHSAGNLTRTCLFVILFFFGDKPRARTTHTHRGRRHKLSVFVTDIVSRVPQNELTVKTPLFIFHRRPYKATAESTFKSAIDIGSRGEKMGALA